MKRDRLSELHAAAAAKGGVCLSGTYGGMEARYRVRCAQGHEWQPQGRHLVREGGTWCPLCASEQRRIRWSGEANPANRRPDRLADLQAAAVAKGGVCLSTDYRSTKVRYRFRCAEGHEWEAHGSRVLYGDSWCRLCGHARIGAATRQRTAARHEAAGYSPLQALRDAAAAKGGVCLSDSYRGSNVNYRFRCAQGHEWEARATAVLIRGTWCRCCADERRIAASKGRPQPHSRKPERIQELHAVAVAKGGVCLSEEYHTITTKYRFRCQQGHEWEATGHNLLALGRWCRRCAHDRRRLGIEVMRQLAEARGGRCLSEEYLTGRKHMRWQCHRGHVWSAMPESIVKGHWCPLCYHLDRSKKSHKRRKYEAERFPLSKA